MKPAERLRRALAAAEDRNAVTGAGRPSAGAGDPPLPEAPSSPLPEEQAEAAQRTRRLAQLRREIERVMGRRPLNRSPAAPPAGDRREPLRVAASASAFSSAATPGGSGIGPGPLPVSSGASAKLPRALDEAGLLYRRDFPAGHCLGRYPLVPPALSQLQQTLSLTCAWDTETEQAVGAEELLFLDIETTGLSRAAGTLAFLVGLGYYPPGTSHLRVDLLLLREPVLEDQLLQLLWGYLARARVLVTFNGRGFDVPVLQNRGVLCRRALPLPVHHLDLLPLCRWLFRSRQLDCRLATLERQQLGFFRQGDLPGAEAPRIYADFLRSGRTAELQQIMEHNLLDVAALAALLPLVSSHLTEPLHWAEDGEELLAVARLYLRRGRGAEAEACFARGLELARSARTRRQLLVCWAAQLRRSKRHAEAAALWQRYCEEFPEQNQGWVELAKYHEHVTRDLPRALQLAQRAPVQGPPELQQRLARLRGRLERARARG